MGRGQVVAGTWSSPQGQRKGHRKILIRGEMGIWKDGLSTAEAEAEVASGEGGGRPWAFSHPPSPTDALKKALRRLSANAVKRIHI